MELRPYQTGTLNVLDQTLTSRNALIVMATGLGKTVMIINWMIQKLVAGKASGKTPRILFVCHRIFILEQAYQLFLELCPHNQYGVPEFSVGFYTGDETREIGTEIVFASFQSLYSGRDSFKENPPQFDFVIVDEAHHGPADTYDQVLDLFSSARLIGLTATPTRMDGQPLEERFGDRICSFDIPFGVREEFLASIDYRVITDDIDRELLKQVSEGLVRSLSEINTKLLIRKRDEEIVRLINLVRVEEKRERAIIFCPTIVYASYLFENFFSAEEARLLHSELPKDFQKQNLDDFRSGKAKVIIVVNQLNEGIDIPEADLLVFLRDTDSETIWLQQLGRGLRRTNGKRHVVVLDFVANVNRMFQVRELVAHFGEGSERAGLVLKVTGEKFKFEFTQDFIDILTILEQKLKKTYISEIPHLAAEYMAKNELPPEKILSGSAKKLWWKCRICGHEWEACAHKRALSGQGCPACANRVASATNNLAITHPELAAEYSEKNEKPANDVVAGTAKKLWWKCHKCEYEWEAAGYSRVNGSGCPACTNQVATETNNLAVTHPELATEYSEKNEKPASQIVAGTNKMLWWRCRKCNHEWQASGNTRITNNSGCPACANRVATATNNLAVTHPDLASEYSEKNEKPANDVVAGIAKKLWWKCHKCEYEWEATGHNRVQERGCPACSNQVATKANNLSITHPKLATEYSEKNEKPASEVVAGTGKKLWWKCRVCGHEWKTAGNNRVKGSGCPACANKVATETNNLAVTHPDLALEYSEKNEKPANEVVAGTARKLWWKCQKSGHEWQASGSSRASAHSGCPACAKEKRRKK